ncbi:MAG: hypothetical protein ABSD02_22185 [Steroidobacteraceae bacterium]
MDSAGQYWMGAGEQSTKSSKGRSGGQNALPGRRLRGHAGDKDRAKAAGFTHHLTTPVDLDDVEQLLREFSAARG